MGKGDRKTAKGKRFMGSYGKTRTKNSSSGYKATAATESKTKKDEPVKKKAAKKADKPAAKKSTAKKATEKKTSAKSTAKKSTAKKTTAKTKAKAKEE